MIGVNFQLFYGNKFNCTVFFIYYKKVKCLNSSIFCILFYIIDQLTHINGKLDLFNHSTRKNEKVGKNYQEKSSKYAKLTMNIE